MASAKALEGKTWNHPVMGGDPIPLRDPWETACYRLPLAEVKGLSKDKQSWTFRRDGSSKAPIRHRGGMRAIAAIRGAARSGDNSCAH